jgi:hypothetical protein
MVGLAEGIRTSSEGGALPVPTQIRKYLTGPCDLWRPLLTSVLEYPRLENAEDLSRPEAVSCFPTVSDSNAAAS